MIYLCALVLVLAFAAVGWAMWLLHRDREAERTHSWRVMAAQRVGHPVEIDMTPAQLVEQRTRIEHRREEQIRQQHAFAESVDRIQEDA